MFNYPTKTQKLLGNPDKPANPTASSHACAGLAREYCTWSPWCQNVVEELSPTISSGCTSHLKIWNFHQNLCKSLYIVTDARSASFVKLKLCFNFTFQTYIRKIINNISRRNMGETSYFLKLWHFHTDNLRKRNHCALIH